MRFGYSIGELTTDTARRIEDAGFDVLAAPDHYGFLSPFPTLAAAAATTTTLRLGTFVVNQDLWPLATLAREVATVDALSGGRFELGIGAGHMESEYDAAGLTFDPAVRRVERLEETIVLLRRLLAGEEVTGGGLVGLRNAPAAPQGADLPVLIGGNGTRLLGVAGRHADIVGFTGFHPADGGRRSELTHFGWDGLADRIAVAREAAGDRSPELNVLVQFALVTDDRAAALARVAEQAGGRMSAAQLGDSPFVAAGPVPAHLEHLERLAGLGVGYVTVFENRSEGYEAVIAASGSQ